MVLDVLYYTHSIHVDRLINDILFEGTEKSSNSELDTELNEIINTYNDFDTKCIKKIIYYILLFDINKGVRYNIKKLIYNEFDMFNIIKLLFSKECTNDDMYMNILSEELNNDTLKYMTVLPVLDYLLNNVVSVDNVKEIKRIVNRIRNIYKLKNMNNDNGLCSICNNKLINVKIMNSNKVCHYCYYTCI